MHATITRATVNPPPHLRIAKLCFTVGYRCRSNWERGRQGEQISHSIFYLRILYFGYSAEQRQVKKNIGVRVGKGVYIY
jgi:hypothetical protein